MGDMEGRGDEEIMKIPNAQWFDISIDDVLFDPYTKCFFFGNDPSAATATQIHAIYLIG